jgi:hypothetical protein
MKDLDPELYRRIQVAHEAAKDAHDYAYKVKTPWWIQIQLGKVQSTLIHYVVKYASHHG